MKKGQGTTTQAVLEMYRRGRITTLQSAADPLGITGERVRQILAKAGIHKEPCYSSAEFRGLGPHLHEVAAARWDERAQDVGYAGFADLIEDLGFRQHKRITEIATLLGYSYHPVATWIRLYTEYHPPHHNAGRHWGTVKGTRQTPEHIAKRMESKRKTTELKRQLGIAFHSRISNFQ